MKLVLIVVFVLGFVQVTNAQEIIIGDAEENVAQSNEVTTLAPNVSSKDVINSTESVVYVINMGPLYRNEVKEDGGKLKAHDVILPQHIGQFSYKGFKRISLTAKAYYGHKAIFFSKKVSEKGPEEFMKGAWLWVLEDGKEPYKTQDLSLLYKLIGKK